MKENPRRKEYLQKGKDLFDAYQAEHRAFMERRRDKTMLDKGVNEENEMRRRYNEKVKALAEEYRDVS
ncbi:MAG: hypothetical protein IJ874_10870 [Ruminococcus sp.]|nr:hypothetical protein [Ruminococcus sp.]